jgi:hypothetical protein
MTPARVRLLTKFLQDAPEGTVQAARKVLSESVSAIAELA